ncbi:TonB-dependent receptor [Novosphingobium sp. BL-52-GroH]|uniref:TonB-dependent receptor n=1 Tax=Novosphingobium sp. BL-52-GroH TaxID=3349877 RepID=UPI00384A4C16
MHIRAIPSHRVLLSTLLAAGAGLPISAFAQQATVDTEATSPASESGLEIVVVARKRLERAQDVPIAITALGGRQLIEQRVQRVTDLIGKVPNMTSDGNGNALGAIGLRGIVSATRNIGFDSGLSVYVDGVLTVRPSSANQELPDIASIEVLRGPQGTLFGRNSTAGAINIISRPASLEEATGDVRIAAGNLGIREASGYVSAPLVQDKLGFKISAYTQNRDGYLYNQTLDVHNNNLHHSGARGGLRWTPSSDLEVTLDGNYSRQKDNLVRGQLLDNTSGTLAGQAGVWQDPFVIAQDNPSFQNISNSTGSLHVNWTLPNDMTLTAISGYGTVKTDIQNDDDARPLALSGSHFTDRSRQFTQELRLASRAGGTFDYLVGAYYFWQSSFSDRSTYVASASSLGYITSNSHVTTDAYAVFASGNFRPARAIEISAGVRYNHEKKSIDFNQADTSVTNLPTVSTVQSKGFTDVTGNLSVTYKVLPAFRVYGSVARGFKSGGFNSDIVSTPDIGFGPEHVWTYEAGFKSEPFGGRTHVNVAVFKSDFTDLQVSQLTANAFQVRNAGSSAIKGAEIEIAAQPLDDLDLNFGAGYTDAKFKRFDLCTAVSSCAGNYLAYVPRWTLSAGAGYKMRVTDHDSVDYRVDWSYRSRTFTDIRNRPTGRLPGYALVNARIAYNMDDARYGIAVFSKNLLNKTYKDYAFFIAPYQQPKVAYALPRTYGIEVFAHF